MLKQILNKFYKRFVNADKCDLVAGKLSNNEAYLKYSKTQDVINYKLNRKIDSLIWGIDNSIDKEIEKGKLSLSYKITSYNCNDVQLKEIIKICNKLVEHYKEKGYKVKYKVIAYHNTLASIYISWDHI